VNPAICAAQKPKDIGKKNYAHTTGKGTPAFLSHHKDNSAAVLHANPHSGAAADLNRIEQQSLHSAMAMPGMKSTHVRSAAAPKLSAPKGDRSTAINFSGRSAKRGLTVTNPRSRGGSQSVPKPH
jgi:hypothetical protein